MKVVAVIFLLFLLLIATSIASAGNIESATQLDWSTYQYPGGGIEDAYSVFIPFLNATFRFGGDPNTGGTCDNTTYRWNGTGTVPYLISNILPYGSCFHALWVPTANRSMYSLPGDENGLVYLYSSTPNIDTNPSSPTNGTFCWFDPYTNISGWTIETMEGTNPILDSNDAYNGSFTTAMYSSVQDRVFTFGGYWYAGTHNSEPKKWVCEHDFNNNTFEAVNTSGTYQNITIALGRLIPAYVPFQDCIYTFGGYEGTTRYDEIYRFNCTNRTTDLVATCTNLTETPGVFYNPFDELIYVVAGCIVGPTYTDDIWTFNPRTLEIIDGVATAPAACDDFSAVWNTWTNKVYCINVNNATEDGNCVSNQKYIWEILFSYPLYTNSEFPTNHSGSASIYTDISINLADYDSDYMSYELNLLDGGSISGSTYPATITLSDNHLDYDTNYTWWFNASDGTNSINESYWFITGSNVVPSVTTPSPDNESTDNPITFTWSILIEDSNNDTFNWTIECNNSQSNFSNDDNNGTKNLSISGLEYGHNYTVWVNVTDGELTTNTSYWFITCEHAVTGYSFDYTTSIPDTTGVGVSVIGIVGVFMLISALLVIIVTVKQYVK